MPLLRILPALLLGGCCCCNIDWLIPDDIGEAATEAIVREGIKVGTGVDVDVDEGRFSIETEEGRVVIGEGMSAVDPRLPVAGHAGCPITGGATAENAEEAILSVAQVDCDVPFDELVAHYEKQVRALGDDVKKTKMSQGQSAKNVMLYLDGNGSRFNKITVTIGLDERGKTSAGVLVTIKH